jgi:hypothetical protein
MPIKNSNDIIGNRTRELPACSAVPQQNALLSAPADYYNKFIINEKEYLYTVKQNVCVGCV